MEPKKVGGFAEALKFALESIAEKVVMEAAENAQNSIARSSTEFELEYEGTSGKSTSEDIAPSKVVSNFERMQAIMESIKRNPKQFVVQVYEDDKVPERAWKILMEEIERAVSRIAR